MGKKFGDRRDGKRLKVEPTMQMLMDLKPSRCNSDVYINMKMDLTKLVEFIEKKKAEGIHYTYFHAFMTAIGKVLYNRPRLNHFVANRHLYEHNEVSIGFAAKVALEDHAEELMMITKIAPEDNLDTLSQKIRDQVEKVRDKSKKLKKEGANDAIGFLASLPNPIRIPVMGLVKWLDAHGWLPADLCKDNIYYCSMMVSNLGSIRCGAIMHNLTNFGTASALATMGEIVDTEVILPDGTKEIRKICEFGINLDERIADGFYMAKSAKLVAAILDDPESLLERADTKIEVDLFKR